MSEPVDPAPSPEARRGWFVVLAWITLVGLLIFTAVMVVCSLRLPQLKQRAAVGRSYGGGR